MSFSWWQLLNWKLATWSKWTWFSKKAFLQSSTLLEGVSLKVTDEITDERNLWWNSWIFQNEEQRMMLAWPLRSAAGWSSPSESTEPGSSLGPSISPPTLLLATPPWRVEATASMRMREAVMHLPHYWGWRGQPWTSCCLTLPFPLCQFLSFALSYHFSRALLLKSFYYLWYSRVVGFFPFWP